MHENCFVDLDFGIRIENVSWGWQNTGTQHSLMLGIDSWTYLTGWFCLFGF